MMKYTSNAWHAVKVVFANEIGNLCKRVGVDSHDVMDIFCKDDKLNLSPYYLKPGFAFGGSCLPKDVRALQYRAKEVDLDMPLINSILGSNRLQVQQAIDRIVETGKKKIGLLGFSFKAGTDDLRESPMVILAEALLGKGYALKIYDRNVSLARLVGANKQYIEEQIPHLSRHLCESIDQVIDESEVIVIGNGSPEFSEAVAAVPAGPGGHRPRADSARLQPGPRRSTTGSAGRCGFLEFFLTWWGPFVVGALDASLVFFMPFGVDALVIYLAARDESLFWIYPILAAAGSVARGGDDLLDRPQGRRGRASTGWSRAGTSSGCGAGSATGARWRSRSPRSCRRRFR